MMNTALIYVNKISYIRITCPCNVYPLTPHFYIVKLGFTSCLIAIKNHWIKYCEKTYEREGINYFWSIKNSIEILNKLKTKGFQASTISTYDFSTLYTTLPHNLIRNQLVDLIENTFRREEALYLACNEERAFFASEEHKKYNLWSCQKVIDALI